METLFKPMSHDMHDRMDLEICHELVRFVEMRGHKAKEEAIGKALSNLKRWRKAGTGCVIRDIWEQYLRTGDWDMIRRTLLDESERGDQMRQMHPFVGILPRDEIGRISRRFYRMHRHEKGAVQHFDVQIMP